MIGRENYRNIEMRKSRLWRICSKDSLSNFAVAKQPFREQSFRNCCYYLISNVTIDLAGKSTVKTFFFNFAPLNGTAFT